MIKIMIMVTLIKVIETTLSVMVVLVAKVAATAVAEESNA